MKKKGIAKHNLDKNSKIINKKSETRLNSIKIYLFHLRLMNEKFARVCNRAGTSYTITPMKKQLIHIKLF